MAMMSTIFQAASRKLSGIAEAEWIATRFLPAQTEIGGTLRFWGQWFGKPYDNWHRLVHYEAQGDLLQLHFNENETLSIWAPRKAAFKERPHPMEPGSWSPSGRVVKEHVFRIADANRVRWEWFYYGRPQTVANRHFIEFARTGSGIETASDTERALRADPKQPAVELISLV
jgi:hypothetical protein